MIQKTSRKSKKKSKMNINKSFPLRTTLMEKINEYLISSGRDIVYQHCENFIISYLKSYAKLSWVFYGVALVFFPAQFDPIKFNLVVTNLWSFHSTRTSIPGYYRKTRIRKWEKQRNITCLPGNLQYNINMNGNCALWKIM